MPDRKTVLIVRVVFAMILLITVFVATVIMQEDDTPRATPAPASQCEKGTIEQSVIQDFALLNVENLRSTSMQTSVECAVYVTFTIAPDSLEVLREMTGADFLETETITQQAGFTNIPSSLDWGIRDDRLYLYSAGFQTDQTIAVDTSDETRYRVYVVYGVD